MTTFHESDLYEPIGYPEAFTRVQSDYFMNKIAITRLKLSIFF